MRGATSKSKKDTSIYWDFYSHAPCGARPTKTIEIKRIETISTHTPHAGRDTTRLLCSFTCLSFLLTRPMRGATILEHFFIYHFTISTHTPHAGRDANDLDILAIDGIFLLTRPMRGATGTTMEMIQNAYHFYSHAPCGARPYIGLRTYLHFYISTHTPHAGRDDALPSIAQTGMHFYSHAPCGARRF